MGHTLADYDVGQIVGKGGFATVYRARDRSNKNEIAIKVIEKEKMHKANISYRVPLEINIHKCLSHKSIVRLYDYFEDEKFIYLVLEFCCNGNLYKQLKSYGPFSEVIAAGIVRQILEALQYVHDRGIVHRDLKLSNILLDNDMNIKICDFGLAVKLVHPDEEHYTLCGTPNYIAPEVVSHKAHGFPADLWSVGCLFFSIITGTPPFEDEGIKVNLDRLLCGEYIEPLGLSAEAIDFIKCLLHPDPSRRSSAKDILSHPFLTVNQTSITYNNNNDNESRLTPNNITEWNDENIEAFRSRNKHLSTKTLTPNQKLMSRSMSSLATHSTSTNSSIPSLSASLEHWQQHQSPNKLDNSYSHRRKNLLNQYKHNHNVINDNNKQEQVQYATSPLSSIGSDSMSSLRYQTYHKLPHSTKQQQQEQQQQVSSSDLLRSSQNNKKNKYYDVDSVEVGMQNNSPLSHRNPPMINYDNQNQSHSNVNRYSTSNNSSLCSSCCSERYCDSSNKSNCHNNVSNQPWANSNSNKEQNKIKYSNSNNSNANVSSVKTERLWSESVRDLPPLKYVSVKGEALLVSEQGDVLFCTKLQIKANKTMTCRLCVRQSNPLQVQLGLLDKTMLRELEVLVRGSQEEYYDEDHLSDEQYLSYNKENKHNNINDNGDNDNDESREKYYNYNIRKPSFHSTTTSNTVAANYLRNPTVNMKSTSENTNSTKNYHHHLHHSNDLRSTSSFTVYPIPPTNHTLHSTASDSSPSFSISNLKVLSDGSHWIACYTVGSLPASLQLIYQKVNKMLEVVKARIPKLILYLSPHKPLPAPASLKSSHTKSKSQSQPLVHTLSPYYIQQHNINTINTKTDRDSNRENSNFNNIVTIASSSVNNSLLTLSPKNMQCKCMLMRNTPLPDFCVQWIDGTKLRYALNSSRLTFTQRCTTTTPSSALADRRKTLGVKQSIEGSIFSNTTRTTAETYSSSSSSSPTGTNNSSTGNSTAITFHWENTSSIDWTESAPVSIREYLIVAQQAMKRCFSEEKNIMMAMSTKETAGNVSKYPTPCNTGHTSKDPIIIVDELEF